MGLEVRITVFGVCEQQRCRPVCASVQSDKYPCYLLSGKYAISLFYMQSFRILAGLGSSAGCFESYLVGNLERQVISHHGPYKMVLVTYATLSFTPSFVSHSMEPFISLRCILYSDRVGYPIICVPCYGAIYFTYMYFIL